MAMGAILALRDAGRRVPDDVSVIGVDGHDLGELVGLTTMAQPAGQQGAMAAGLVLDMIAGVGTPQDTVVQTRLLLRSSTGPAPGSVGTAAAASGVSARVRPDAVEHA